MRKAFMLIFLMGVFINKGFAHPPHLNSTLRPQPLLSVFKEKNFNTLFPLRNPFYTYRAFATALQELSAVSVKIEKRGISIYRITRTDKKTGKAVVVRQDKDWDETWAREKVYSFVVVDYGSFCAGKNAAVNKKELAAFLAHIAHETRNGKNGLYNDGLMLIHELNTDSAYTSSNPVYPAVQGKKYYGRGPLQLSYNGNYGFASDCIFGDKRILLNNPDLLSSNAVIAFKTALYFWMTPQSNKPSAHQAITGLWQPSPEDLEKGRIPGFGLTTNIINGRLECNQGKNNPAMNNRMTFYQHFLRAFGMPADEAACSCESMQPF